MVLAPILSLYKKSVAMCRAVLRIAMDFFVNTVLDNKSHTPTSNQRIQ